MPSFESPALYIDFARLPPPKVIEEIDFEVLLAAYKAQVLAKKPELAAALALEQSPTNVILEAEAYGEMIVRERINAAARASMLPFATGSDLDVIGARFNVPRMTGELDLRFAFASRSPSSRSRPPDPRVPTSFTPGALQSSSATSPP